MGKRGKIALSILLIIIVVVSASVSAFMATPKASLVWGTAYVDSPVVGGTVNILSVSGNKLFEASNETSDGGVYFVSVPWIWTWSVPSEFKITVTGGTLNGEPFNGTLVRYINNYDEKNYYAINPITTLEAAYKDLNPSLSNTALEENIRRFLEIPSLVSLSDVINEADHSRIFFDGYTFASEANANGSFNGFIENLALQIASGQTHPFKSELVSGPISDFAVWAGSGIAKGIGAGALSYVGGVAMGWIMKNLGYESDTQEILDQLHDMQIKLDQINNKLDVIEAQLSDIQNQLTSIDFDLKETIMKIGSIEAISRIDSATIALDTYAKDKPGDLTNRTLEDWVSAVLSPTTGILDALTQLNNYAVGHTALVNEGLLEVMVNSAISTLVKPGNSSAPYQGRDYRTQALLFVKGLTTYFQELLIEEVKGLNLLAEAHHYRNENGAVESFINRTWQPMINNQVNVYVGLVEKFVINVELREPLEFPNMGPVPASVQDSLNSYWQTHYPGLGATLPSVAEILPQVYRFADQVTNGTGRFSAAVLIMPPTTNPSSYTPIDPKPTFRNTVTGKTYQASGVLHKMPLFFYGGSQMVYYFTYDYGTLPEGTYVLSTSSLSWWSPTISSFYEYWDYHAALDWSLNRGYIQVTNDSTGRPYGYWGGVWI